MKIYKLLVTSILALHASFTISYGQSSSTADFSFLTGSCADIEVSLEDSSGVLYNGDTSILYHMANMDSDFMLWLGDNWYLDYDEWGQPDSMRTKAREARSARTVVWLKDKPTPEYAIWDDHDYGPNQSTKNFPLKQVSREIFMNTWTDNPGYGEHNEGIYTSFRYNDVKFILLDDRWWRDRDNLWAYKWWHPNKDKRMFGKQQMKWLKQQLTSDTSTAFKFIVNGNQILNPWSESDGLIHYPIEYNELLDFIRNKNIPGVVFLTGDKHYSEIIRKERKGKYTLFEITVSPLTSSPSQAGGTERLNKYRVSGTLVETNNFARISVTGEPGDRQLKVQFFDSNKRKVGEWQVSSTELHD